MFGELLSESGLPPGVVDVASVIVSAYPDATEGFAFCLSEEDDLLSQWRAYGRDATGLSIGFDVEALKADFGKVNFGSQFFELIKVGYGSDGLHELLKPIVANVRATFQKHGDFVRLNTDLTREKALIALTDREGDIRGLFVGRDKQAPDLLAKLSEALAGIHFKVYGTKSHSFHEEKEWRLLRYRHRVSHPEVKYFADDASIRPYIPCLLADPARQAIRTVILGPKHHSDINWLRAFLESVGLGHVKVRRSAIESYR